MKRLAKSSLGVKLGASFALLLVLMLVIAGVALNGYSSQGAAAKTLSDRLRLTQEVMQVKFRGADFNGWQTAYAFDIIRGLRGATADSASVAAHSWLRRRRFAASSPPFSASG